MTTPPNSGIKPLSTTNGPAVQLPTMKQFRLRLKDRHDVREVIITARDLTYADRVGNKYCDVNKYKFIRVESMVVADEDIL